jgi:hypothetical protein
VNQSSAETTRVTISLPTSLVRELDDRLVHGNTTRDVAIQGLIEAAFHELDARERRRGARERWTRDWQQQSEADEEFGWTTSSAALAHLAEIPWAPDVEPSGGQTSQTHGDVDQCS